MFIAIIGTRFSGKRTIEQYLVSQLGFTSVSIDKAGIQAWEAELQAKHRRVNVISPAEGLIIVDTPQKNTSTKLSEIRGSADNTIKPSEADELPPVNKEIPIRFNTPPMLLDYMTKHWQQNFVTVDLQRKDLIEIFIKRPYFMIVNVDAPLMLRFNRHPRSSQEHTKLEEFIRDHDNLVYGAHDGLSGPEEPTSNRALRSMRTLINVHIDNSFATVPALYDHLEKLDLLNMERLRPGWDTYFMTLASLASHRSNCMKRRVGAVIVRDRRIVSTGYNGTPRFLKNCNEGGCGPCNGYDKHRECICLHAEENAILEAGRERVGGATLYSNTFPCEKCTIKIVQSGVKEVVYNLSYKMDQYSAQLLEEAGISVRRHAPPSDT